MKKFKLLDLPDNPRFTTKAIFLLILPIFIEQLLLSLMGFADSLMIARSPNGGHAMAGVDLIRRIDDLIKQVCIALSAGGSVIVAMYLGAKDKKNANLALKNCITILCFFSCALALILFPCKTGILNFIYNDVNSDILNQSISYFSITIISYPLMMIYYSCSAAFRAMKNSVIPLFASFLMMGINLLVKYILIFHFDMGVTGAGLSTLIAFGSVGIIMLILLHRRSNEAYIDNIFKVQLNFSMIHRVFKVGIPNGIENGLFQLGAIILQSLISSLGDEAIMANTLIHNLTFLTYSMATAFTLGILPFVSQCIGAKSPEDAVFYTKYIIKLEHLVLTLDFLLVLPLYMPFARIFNMSESVTITAVKVVVFYAFFTIIFYPSSLTLPNALRATGDTKFTMIASITTMFVFRIGFAYFLVHKFNLGVEATWIAMIVDWIIRGIIFKIRLKSGKWKKKAVI